MNKFEILKTVEAGWYVEDLVKENMADFEDLLTGNILSDKINIISRVRRQFFANNECKGLSALIKNNEYHGLETFRLCEAVFAESIASQGRKIVKHILDKVYLECSDLSEEEIGVYLKLLVEDLGSSTVRQLLTRPILNKTVILERRSVRAE